ncbi:MAG: ATP-binding cassette domain-containing protein [Candidatus Omnitrophica bacterium]|nr:ATP-binding cassette domain-containing protein [Candidatus Omnitrophota bacterium]
MINIINGKLQFGERIIFTDVSWRIEIGRRVGLVGPNGAGKTTLLRVLHREKSLDEGTVEISNRLRIGYLPQDCPELPEQLVREVLWQAFEPLNRLEQVMNALLETIQNTPHDDPQYNKLLHRYSEMQERFQEEGGYQRESNAFKVLLGLGFRHEDWERPVAEFSGGWRMRILLANLLLQDPDILLLDEPTNHLDPPSLAWFEEYLLGSQSGIVIISHDRYFLNRVVSEIAEIDQGRFRLYRGNYSEYKRQREALREQLLAQQRSQEKEIAHLQSYVDRFRARKDKAAQAQSRLKRLEKIDRIEIQGEGPTVSIPMPETPRSGKEVLILENVGHCYGEVRALKPFSAAVYRGDRVAVWGANGAGKSTLLSLMAQVMKPSEGSVKWGYNTHVAYFSQHQAELQASSQSVLDELSSVAPAEMQSCLRDVLAPFLFRGDDVFKPVSVLSGGEKSRLALAKLLIRPVNVLIMDEPLNHLDIDTVETLEETLRKFSGTLIFVSHDRYFADRLATHVWEMDAGAVECFPGTFQQFDYAKQQRALEQDAQSQEKETIVLDRDVKKEQKRREAEERNRLHALRREKEKRIQSVESQIHEVEAEIDMIEEKMASGELIRKPSEMSKFSKRYKSLLKIKEKLYAQWEKEVEKLDVT